MNLNHIACRKFQQCSQVFYTQATNAPLEIYQTSVLSVPNCRYNILITIYSCNNNGICSGVQLLDTCSSNSECYFGLYCNEGGRCVKYKDVGERCSSNEACGKKALCIYETTLSTYGSCQSILTFSVGTLVLPMYKVDMTDTDSGIYVY